jgi:hypothetical protein
MVESNRMRKNRGRETGDRGPRTQNREPRTAVALAPEYPG